MGSLPQVLTWALMACQILYYQLIACRPREKLVFNTCTTHLVSFIGIYCMLVIRRIRRKIRMGRVYAGVSVTPKMQCSYTYIPMTRQVCEDRRLDLVPDRYDPWWFRHPIPQLWLSQCIRRIACATEARRC
jgi:hypothetical protein